MKQLLTLLSLALYLTSCGDPERNNPDDPHGINYQGNQQVVDSGSTQPSNGSSSSVARSSSSVKASSSSRAASSSSAMYSSSNIPTQTGIITGSPVVWKDTIYQTVVIGAQTWLQRNLNYAVTGSKCGGQDGSLSDYDTPTCNTHGRLYDWVTAMNLSTNCKSSSCSSQVSQMHQGICPDGWHIPSNADWDNLMRFVDQNTGGTGGLGGGNGNTPAYYNSSDAGMYLKAKSGWDSNGNGQDTYGFSALPGGSNGYLANSFSGVGKYGNWWSSSEDNGKGGFAYGRYMESKAVYGDSYEKSNLYSVRCVMD